MALFMAHAALLVARSLSVVLGVILALAAALPATADILSPDPVPTTTLQVAVGKSVPLVVAGDVELIVLSQPDIARVDQVGPRSVYVIGREIGATNLLLYGPDARLLQVVNIEVGYDGPQLQDELAAILPDEQITVANLNGGLLLRGTVSSPQAAAMANDLAERAAAGDVISILDVRPDQVLLEVQLIEVSEETLRDIGVDLGVQGSGVSFGSGSGLIGIDAPQSLVAARGRLAGLDLDAVLRTLEQTGSARILARPQLLALSGEKASFRSGGEFPFPVPTRDGITVEFKPYGTAISVLPTVLTNGLIRLDLSAEVSSIDPRNSLRIGNLTVPALSTRRSATSLELRDGERFMFAGLFSEADQDQVSQTPGAGDLPLVGNLFRAVRTKSQRMQLAIIVTAHVIDGPNTSAATPIEPEDLLSESDPATMTRLARPITPEPRPKGLLKRIRSLPIVDSLTRKLVSISRQTLDVPARAWGFVESLSRRLASSGRAAVA